jgi:diaminopimelate decarboxylase
VDHFHYSNDCYLAEEVPLAEIAEAVGTPCYVYSRATIERHWRVFDAAFGQYPHKVCYSVKANSSLAVLDLLARLGSGFDIVSGGELERVLRAGGGPSNVVFSGVGKSKSEIQRALQIDVGCLNLESESELYRVAEIANELAVKAPISIRINPDVDPLTHPYIATGLRDNKFGVAMQEALGVFKHAANMGSIEIKGVACHIGSQLTETGPFVDALEKVVDFVEQLTSHGIELDHLDIGGGLGIHYHDENPPDPETYTSAVIEVLERRGCRLPVVIEPGRAIVGNAGVLLTRVEYLKHGDHRNFAVVDAGMNDLLRPALYQGFHEIVPLQERESTSSPRVYDVVGPVCESADFLGHKRSLAITEGDFLALRSVGAYGFVMSSVYNSRVRPAEVIVDGDRFHVVRKRETVDQLMENECLFPG